METKKALTPAERLVVAADFKPQLTRGGRDQIRGQVLSLAAQLKGTGVYLKVNWDDSTRIHDSEEAVSVLANEAYRAGLDGLVLAGRELADIKEEFGNRFGYNVVGVRPIWSRVDDDDQSSERFMTPAEAIRTGADRVIVGRPITQSPDPYRAMMRIRDEIEIELERVRVRG